MRTLNIVLLMSLVSLLLPLPLQAATSFPRQIADLEKYDNSRLRSPLLSLGSISYGVIDYRNDVDFRRVRIKRSGAFEVRVKTYRGSIKVELYRNENLVDHASSQLGKPVVLKTTGGASDVFYIKINGTKGAQYRLFVK